MTTPSNPTVAQLIGCFGGGGAQSLALNLVTGCGKLGLGSLGIAVRTAGVVAGAAEIVELDADRHNLLAVASSLRRTVRERRVDVLHVHGQDAVAFAGLALSGMRRPPRLCFTWHDSQEVLNARGARRWATIRALRRCERVWGSSRSVAERLDRAAGLGGRVAVFRNGVDATGPSRRTADEVPTVLWAARFIPPKDPHALVRAAARLRDEGHKFRVVIAGDALPHLQWLVEETRALVARHGLGEVVSMPGWVRHAPDAVLAASIAVQTSHTEGLSMSLLEQMMAGLAVVATNVGDTECAIRDGQQGLLVPAGDDAALVAALRRVVADADLRVQLGAAARARALDEFSTEAMTRRAVEAYRGMHEDR